MKQYLLIVLLAVVVLAGGCKKKTEVVPETLTKFPVPTWQVDDTGKYPVSMTAVVDLPYSVKPFFDTGDMLGAFVNDECRGLGVVVNVNTSTPLFYVLIKGTASAQDKIKFTYYSKKTSFKYSTTAFLDFAVDGNFGSPDQPQVLNLAPDR